MGADPATIGDIILAVGSIGAGGLSSALAPNPYQKKNSFGGGTDSISARGWLTDMRQLLGLATTEGFGQYNEGVDLSGTMPDGNSLPSFSGGTLPMRVGASSNVHPSSAAGHGAAVSGPLPLRSQPGAPALPPGTTIGSDDGSGRVFNPSDPTRWHTMGFGAGADPNSGNGTMQQGQGAAQLLLHALTGGGGQVPRFA